MLTASDQLRQRAAWSLAQIFVNSGKELYEEISETWMSYYDIFVRHAFGNVLDILKEVTFSPQMGMYLTFIRNKSFRKSGTFPDENYAREIMQLFSVGLWKMERDGTILQDDQGVDMPTYTNDDIVTFARVWTGFDDAPARGNVEHPMFGMYGRNNKIDPMVIKQEWRDVYPKTKLDSGYIGDQYPLCGDLPAQHFLIKGAKYESTGAVSEEGTYLDNPLGDGVSPSGKDQAAFDRGRFTPDPTGPLYAALCATDGSKCTFPKLVVLPSTLPCTGHMECGAGYIRTAKVVDPQDPNDPDDDVVNYFTFQHPPCVQLTFFGNQAASADPTASPGKVSKSERDQQCSNPVEAHACCACCHLVDTWSDQYCSGEVCDPVRIYGSRSDNDIGCPPQSDCPAGPECAYTCTEPDPFDGTQPFNKFGGQATGQAKFAYENMNFAMCEDRCRAMGGRICLDDLTTGNAAQYKEKCGQDANSWTDMDCGLKIQIDSTGFVTLIDPVAWQPDTVHGGLPSASGQYGPDNGNAFRVYWNDGSGTAYPTAATGCSLAGCDTYGETCICDVSVTFQTPFTDPALVPSDQEVRETLLVGATDTSLFPGGTFTQCVTDACVSAAPSVVVWEKVPGIWDQDTVFEVPHHPRRSRLAGKKLFLKNVLVTVHVGTGTGLSFRNPPPFQSRCCR